MKNMLGCAPPSHTPDLTILDASVGMARYYPGGPRCNPPVGKLIGGFDPVALDAYGAGLLGVDWRSVEHISLAHTILGNAESAL